MNATAREKSVRLEECVCLGVGGGSSCKLSSAAGSVTECLSSVCVVAHLQSRKNCACALCFGMGKVLVHPASAH